MKTVYNVSYEKITAPNNLTIKIKSVYNKYKINKFSGFDKNFNIHQV